MTQRDAANDIAGAVLSVLASALVYLWLLPRAHPLAALLVTGLVWLALAYGWLAMRRGSA